MGGQEGEGYRKDEVAFSRISRKLQMWEASRKEEGEEGGGLARLPK